MLRAIAGSMIVAGGVTTLSAASDRGMLWPMVKAVTIRTSAPQAPPVGSRPIRADRRLDDRRRRRHHVERRQRQGDAVADGEGGDDPDERSPGAASEEQADREQEGLGP